jgi:putative tryptophan/tyrosine transport system substrate-binding protein
MRRREFIAVLGGAAAMPLVARAQQQAKPLIGFLRSTSAASSARLVAAFRQGLKQSGFVEGQDVSVEYRWGDDQLDRLPELVDDLIRRQPALIVGNVLAIQALIKTTTSTIPIVFVSGSDPVRIGLVPSLNRPGGNLTGVVFISSDLTAKRFELLDAVIPKSASVALMFDPNAPSAELPMKDVEEAGRKLGRQIMIVRASNERELHDSFVDVVQKGVGGLLIGNSAFFLGRRRQLAMLAARHGLPTSAGGDSFVEAGILMSYGASQTDAYRRAGDFAGRILKGVKPSDMPVELATKIDLVINLATAKALGINIPSSLLAIADEVIE